MNNSDQQLKRNYLELKEWQHVLEKADQFFEGVCRIPSLLKISNYF